MSNTKIVRLYLLITFLNCSYSYAQTEEFTWGEKEKLEKIRTLQDSTKWNMEMLQEDLKQNRSPLSQEGMDFGAFPVVKYSQGLISGSGSDFEYFGKKLYWNYFGGEKNTVNQAYLKDKHDEIFFAIIILTDVLDFSNENYNMTYSVISRNYPDKLGNGLLKTKNHSIEYTAFLTGDRKQFALVNLRLFDLDQGGLILIAPQKDGSLRSMQLEMPLLETKEID